MGNGRCNCLRRDKNAGVVVGAAAVAVLFNIVFDSSAGEASLSHDSTNTRVIKNRDNEMLKLNFNGKKRMLVLMMVVNGG